MSRTDGWGLLMALAGTAIAAGTVPAASADSFEERCQAPGVIRCVSFDTNADMMQGDTLFPAWDGVIRGTLDTSVRASGTGSLRFEIPSNSQANSSGFWLDELGDDFGSNESFFVQFRQRFSRTMVETNFAPQAGWKQVIIHGRDGSCANMELTTQNTNLRGYPQMYSACGAQPFEVPVGGSDFLYQQGDYNCRRSDPNPTDCSYYRPDEWMTFYYEIRIGTLGTPSTSIAAYVAYEGGPLKQFIDMTNFRLNSDTGPSDGFAFIQLTPYHTGKSGSQSHPTAHVWYDELIISRQPIAGPDGSVGDTIPPGAPQGLTLEN